MASNSAILEKQVAELRTELKAWEKAFATTHGRKAGRDDISGDACMSVKYREFHRLRRPIDNPPGAAKVETPRKARQLRQPGSHHKRSALRERAGSGNEGAVVTPRKAWKGGVSLEVVREEEQEVEPTPAFIRCALGPTPQKDGQVLGIFDFATTATPSKSASGGDEVALPIISDTPSKPTVAPTPLKRARSATPVSSSKRRLLDAFAGTPLKRQKHDDAQTPSTSKHYFSTPSFLRRSFPLAPVDEDPADIAPLPKKRGLVRSLSSLIQGLRKQEDKRMDDEWDIMNELEATEDNNDSDSDQPPNQRQTSKVLVDDSQTLTEPELPLGPDQGPPGSDSENGKDSARVVFLGADGKPRKPWKKKGLKRQTKRTNMRPMLHKPKKAGELDEVDQQSENEAEAGGETQDAHGNDDEDDGGDDDNHHGSKAKRTKAKAAATNEAAASPAAKKAPKKVSAGAHANFRRLNIKNKNSKANGKGGGGRKFGRR
ncbi:hypothetical protein B0A55_08512 [Friedmanniomyces simplex]|uniref:DNA replication regulator SLD2 n=1 Tax=Friedmanniomyces simplex TaxID=329884 RepID=A0A4U0WZJ1_9PEZI|nr:hypothetical protein B0A55_08512 [Friedmanniomyces simplex]